MNPGSPPNRELPHSHSRRVAGNAAYLALADIANKVLMFFFFVLAARHLGVEKFGAFSFALAFVTMFAVLADLGLGAYTAREVARDGSVANRLFANALSTKVFVSLLLVVSLGVISVFVGFDAARASLIRVSSLFILASSVVLFCGAVFQGFERMVYTALVRVVQTILLLTGAVLLSRGSADPVRYAWLYSGCGLAAAVLALALSTRFVAVRLNVKVADWVRMLKGSLPMGLAAVFAVLYYWNGTALLALVRGDAAAGVFNAAFRLSQGVVFAAFAFSGAIYPVMSRASLGESARLGAILTKSLRYMVILAVPLGVIGSVLAGDIVRLLYGSEYAGAAVVLMVLVWWASSVCLNSVLAQFFYSSNRAGVVTAQTASSLGVCVLTNLLLIPRFGALGAAVALVAAEAIGLTFLLVAQSRTPHRARLLGVVSVLVRASLAATLAAAGGWFGARLHPIAGVLVAALLYVPILIAFRGLKREDLALLQVLRRGVYAKH